MARDRPIHGVADLQCLRLRVPEGGSWVPEFRALGADPVPMPWGDAPLAFAAGAVDAVEATPEVVLTQGFAGTARYIARTNHVIATLQLLASERNHRRWPAQDAIAAAARQAWRERDALARADNDAAERALVEAGITYTRPNLRARP